MTDDVARVDFPLFPLHTVLYPGGLLPLRIFEPRYVDMVRDCMRDNAVFGVVLIRSGREAGAAAEPQSIGTTARIRDFDRGPDGLLHILAVGEQRFLIHTRQLLPNSLQVATAEPLLDEPRPAVPSALAWLTDVLRELRAQSSAPVADELEQYDDGNWLGYRLAELLPLPASIRQRVLDAHCAADRLALIGSVLEVATARH
jgi:Lon protease-like protein